MKIEKKRKAFTLIELLVVISILGILMGIVGPKVVDLLGSSEKTKMQAIIRGWVSNLQQYKSYYGYFPPFLLSQDEGIPFSLSDKDIYDSFLISLKGKKLTETGWTNLDADNTENRRAKEFHSFTEDEFDENGKLIGAENVMILVDQDGDGTIQLQSNLVEDILNSLKIDYSTSELDQVDRDSFSKVHEKAVIFILNDDDLDLQNIFSWNIQKFFE